MKKVTVSAEALRLVLNALNGPAHYVRELQVTLTDDNNPINILNDEYNAAAIKACNAEIGACDLVTAKELAEQHGHTNIDNRTTLKTVKNEDADDEEKDIMICGFGDDAYFEWVTEYGDPIGGVFYAIEKSDVS